MDLSPLNLVLAVATAFATIFIGFLPTRNIESPFFAREVLKAAFAWVVVAARAPALIHYYFFFALLCFGSWWKFRGNHVFGGKMWLSLASGLGISVGVMLLLATTPGAYPGGMPELSRAFLLASIYLGGGTIGLAYVCYVLGQGFSARMGVRPEALQRYVKLLLGLTLARSLVLLGIIFLLPAPVRALTLQGSSMQWAYLFCHHPFLMEHPAAWWALLGMAEILLPGMVFSAWRTPRSAQSTLRGVVGVGLVTETLIRLWLF